MAHQRNLVHKAPRAGTIGRVRLMSCEPGSFRVQVAREVPGTSRYRVVKNGPLVRYQGDQQGCGDNDDFVYRCLRRRPLRQRRLRPLPQPNLRP